MYSSKRPPANPDEDGKNSQGYDDEPRAGEHAFAVLGILQAQFCPPLVFRQEIRRVRALTAKPFGVNLLLHFPAEDQVAICLEERVQTA